MDVAIAKTVRSVQLRNGVRDDNEWVSVETVNETLRELYERVEAEPPAYEELTEIRKRSRLLDTTVDIDADELIVKLTDAGEIEAEPDTGDVRSAGGSDHDDALLEIEQAFEKADKEEVDEDGFKVVDETPEFKATVQMEVQAKVDATTRTESSTQTKSASTGQPSNRKSAFGVARKS